MQQRLRNYKHELLSFEHNLMNLGLHNPGRYAGFDTLEPLDQTSFRISHAGTGITYKNELATILGPVGIAMTGQGVILLEDAPIGPFTWESNAGNNKRRYDLIVLKHSFVKIKGGSPGTYEVIKGSTASEIKPIPIDPLKDIPIGIIEIPANCSNISECTFTKAKCPDSGDGEDARLTDPNVFRAIQLFNRTALIVKQPSDSFQLGTRRVQLWELNNDANTFDILPTAQDYFLDGLRMSSLVLQEGMQIKIAINAQVKVRSVFQTGLPNEWVALGYRPIVMHSSFTNNAIGGDEILSPNPGETWFLELLYYSGTWVILDVTGKNSGQFVSGLIIPWKGQVNNNFDSTGLGINKMIGWAICNGNNGTDDWRGRTPIMATDNVPSQGAPDLSLADPNTIFFSNAGDKFGEVRHLLTIPEMPRHNHTGVEPDPTTGETPAGTLGLIPRSHIGGGEVTGKSYDFNGEGTEPDILHPPKGVPMQGSDLSHNNMQPIISTIFIQKL